MTRFKKRAYRRMGRRCTCCGFDKNLTIHHVRKHSDQGKNTKDNLIILCNACHKKEHKEVAK